MSYPRINFHYPTIIGYGITITEHTIIFPLSESYRACALSRDLQPGAKIVHIFEIPGPNLSIYFVTFQELRRKSSYVICEKFRFPIVKATKFTAHAQYHETLHRASPIIIRSNFLTRLIYSLYNFCGTTMTIKGSSYRSISMLKRSRTSQNRSQNGVFFENLIAYILVVVIGTPKKL